MNLEEIERNVVSFKSHFGRGQLAVSYFFFALTAAQRLLCAAAIRCRAPALMRRGPRFSLEAAFDELDTVRWPEPLPAFFRTAQRLFCAAEILALASSMEVTPCGRDLAGSTDQVIRDSTRRAGDDGGPMRAR